MEKKILSEAITKNNDIWLLLDWDYVNLKKNKLME